MASARRGRRRPAAGDVECGILVRLHLFGRHIGSFQPRFQHHQPDRRPGVSELHHRALSLTRRGEPLRPVRRYCGIDGTGRATRRRWHSSFSRSYLSSAHRFGRGLPRRGAELCRRRSHRDVARARWGGRLPPATVFRRDAEGPVARGRAIRARIRRRAQDSRQPAFRAGDRRRDRRRQTRDRLQWRCHEYRSAAGRAQPKRRWRLSRFPRGDGAIRFSAAVSCSRAGPACHSRRADGIDVVGIDVPAAQLTPA